MADITTKEKQGAAGRANKNRAPKRAAAGARTGAQRKQTAKNTQAKPQAKATQEKAKATPAKGAQTRAPQTKRAQASKPQAGLAANTARSAKGAKLKVIPLGGLNEIGKNMTVLEYGNDIIVVDCGMTFPDDEMLGVDLVIPDITYLLKNRERVRGIILTHGHEDHIGALPYVLRELNVPIYCTALTAGIISLKLSEHRNLGKVKINVRKAGDRFKLGAFDIEMIHINHSIADAVAYAIRTPLGTVVVTGDFKIDTTPVDGAMIDLKRFGELGDEGVLLLFCDSTNAERPGIASSERKVSDAFDVQFKNCNSRIVVATFASNVHRLQQIINIAAKYGRKVAISGRSMENIMKVATELGYIKLPANTLVTLPAAKKLPKEKVVIISTGSQGEPMSALNRMAFSEHRQVEVGPGDKILIAAQPIPGNEKSVYQMINELFRRGCEVVYEKLADIHVSGHACQEELKTIMSLTRPKYFMPAHGEYRHLLMSSRLGEQTGIKKENIFISDIGKVLEIGAKGAKFNGTVPCGRVLVDGNSVGDVGAVVLRERKQLSESGLITVSAAVDWKNGALLSGVEVDARGFMYMKEAEDIVQALEEIALQVIEQFLTRKKRDKNALKADITSKLSDYLFKKLKRSPMIVPLMIEL